MRPASPDPTGGWWEPPSPTLQPFSGWMPGLTSVRVGLIHGLCGEEDDTAGLPLLQEAPHVVPGARVQPGRWLVQKQHLQRGVRSGCHVSNCHFHCHFSLFRAVFGLTQRIKCILNGSHSYCSLFLFHC